MGGERTSHGSQAETTPAAGREVVSGTVNLRNGRTYHFVTAGPQDAPPLVYLHGYSDSWRSAELLIPHLSDRFRIHALDQRGHGRTGGGFADYAIDSFTADAAEFVAAVVGRPVTLVRHSLGSLVGQRLAARHSEMIERLVLIASADTSGGNEPLAAFGATLAEFEESLPYDFVYEFQASTLANPIDPTHLEAFVQESMRLDLDAWRKVAAALVDDTAVVAMGVHQPTLVLWGDRDSLFDAEAQRKLLALLPRGELRVYPGVGHGPNWEVPGTVARDIIAFHGG
ncbi:MAG TPA: alpha/beta hydrolase [Candidatus Binatia bacterium]|nr:alpha/beta hydrolase [Candidatus Binatia bacterium]